MTHLHEARPTRRQAALALTTLTALALSACGASDGEAEFEDGATTPAPQDSAPQEPAASDGGGEDSAPEAADEAPAGEVIDPGDAVDTITYTLPTDEIDGTMTVGFHHLRARGSSLELLLTYTPEFTGHEAYTLWELHGRFHPSVAPALFDRENLKRYDILRKGPGWDGTAIWNSKQAKHKLTSGDTQAYWANFAAPEDDIDTINIAIAGAPEFADVPIEQGTSADGSTDGQE